MPAPTRKFSLYSLLKKILFGAGNRKDFLSVSCPERRNMTKRKAASVKANKKAQKRKNGINTKVKDTLFRHLFGEASRKSDLLSLYNALRGTAYTEESALEIYTISNAIFMGYKNDIGFILDCYLSLWEHQSTKNKNMPLRGLLYHAKMYEKYIKDKHLDIHSTTIQKIPSPQYYVFYNGDENAEDTEILKLSDSFMTPVEKGTFEWTATVININLGHNNELMKQCTTLKEYATFIDKIKEGLHEGLKTEEAVRGAVDWCIENSILKDYLVKHKSEVVGMVLTEYDEKKHIAYEKQLSHEEGRIEGKIESKIEDIKNMIEELGISLSKALSVAKMSLDDWNKYNKP